MTDSFAQDVDTISRIDAVQKILEVVCQTTGMGFSAVARVTESRWIACAVRDLIGFGLKPGGELKLETTLCDEIRESGELIVIDDVATDAVYCNHHTPRTYGLRSYISVPIKLQDGRFFGTLCAIDTRPAKLKTPQVIGMFTLFADLIAQHLDAHRRIDASEAALSNAREAADMREQFIAVLGHDLRNPLAAIDGGAELLGLLPHDEETLNIIKLIQRSAGRMAELINDLLDFARGRLGGGMSILSAPESRLEHAIEQVIGELQTAWPDREIHQEVRLDRSIDCDRARLAQMLSNLLANALTHGSASGPVRVRAHCDFGMLELSVANPGQPIPAEVISTLFQPFARGTSRPNQQGLGLGLYIASEIARAHGGSLTATSTADETRFTFRMPLKECLPIDCMPREGAGGANALAASAV